MNFIENEKRIHKFTSEQKIKWWDDGEWVNEPDEVNFQYLGFECLVKRIAFQELYIKDFPMFGGYLNGYVLIPSNHTYYKKEYKDMDINCHGGLTFGEYRDIHFIGFDTAHSCDYVPSMEYIKKTLACSDKYRKNMDDLKEEFNIHNSQIFKNTYRNIDFCIEQCKSICKQLKEAENE